MRTERAAHADSRRTPAVSARSAGWLSIIVVIAIGLLRLAGGLLHVTLLTRVAPTWVEMKTITMLCFLLSAVALTLIYLRPAGSRRSIGAMLLGGIVALVGLVTIADYVSQLVTGQASAVTQAPFLNLFFAAHTRMALMTAVVFTLVGFALTLLAGGSRRAADFGHALAVPAATASYIVPLSYLLGVQSMSAVLGTPMALNTGLAFCFFCLAVFCARTDTWLMKALTGDEIGAYMARRLLPALMATPLVIGWFRLEGERTGLFSSEVGVALVAATYTVVFVVLVWLAARAANRTDSRRRAAEHAARDLDERYRELFAGSPIGIYRTTPDGRTLAANPALVKLLGYESLDELTRRNLESEGFEPSYPRSEFKAAMERDGRVTGLESAWRRRDGTIVYLRENARDVRDPQGRIAYYDGTVEDITERKLHESRIARLTRLYSVLSTASEAIVRARDEAALLDRVCTIVAEDGGFPLVWVGRVEGQEVRPVAVCGPAAGYLKEIRVEVAGTLGSGPTGTCIREDRPVANADFDANAATAPWREPARRHGFRASVALPLHRGGKAVGALTIYAREPGAFDAEQLKLLESLCADVSYAFDALDAERLRLQTEQALRESRDEWERTFNTVPDLIAILDGEHRVVRVNKAMADRLGVTPEQARGMHCYEVVHGTSVPPEFCPHALTCRDKSEHAAEVHEPRLGGDFLVSTTPLCDVQGRLIGSIHVARDITTRKRAEAALAASEEQFRAVSESSAVQLAVARASDGVILFTNPAYDEVFGYERGELLDHRTPELYADPADRAPLLAELEASGFVRDREVRLKRRDGSVFWVSLSLRRIRFGGEPAVISAAIDIGERKLAEDALRLSEQKFALSFAGNPAAVALTRLEDGLFVDVNDAWVALTGFSREEAIGHSARGMHIWPSAESASRFVEELRATGTLRGREQEFLKKSGEVYVAQLSAQVLVIRDERIILSTLVDITARKRAEDAVEADLAALTMLQKLGTTYVREGNLEPVLGQVVETAIAICGADFGNIHLIDPDTGDLRIKAHRGFPPWWLDFWDRVSRGTGTCGTALARGERVIVEDVEQSPIFAGKPGLEIQRRAGVRAVQSTPLVSRSGKPLGMFSTHYRSPHRFDQRVLAHLDLLARQAADIIERAQAEDALREGATRLQSILEATQESIWLFSTDGRILDANGTAAARFGLKPADVVGKRLDEIVSPELSRSRFERIREVADSGQPVEFVDERAGMQFRHSFYPVLDAGGRVTAVVSFSRDITESRRAEQALRVSEERFRAVAFNTPDHILVQDRELRYELVVNPQLGLTEQDMLGKTDYDFLSESDADRLTAMKRQVMQTGQPLHVEMPLTSAKGEPELFDGTYVPRFDPQGRSNGVIGYFRNVTERKRAEQALREAKESLEVRVKERTAELTAEVEERKRAEERLAASSQYSRSLLESSLDPLVTISAEGKVTDVNEATVTVTGVPREQLIGTDFSDYFTEPEKAREGYRRVFANTFVTDYPLTICHRDGHLTDVLYNASVYKDPRGNVIGVFAAARDVTDRKRAEEALRKAHDSLEVRVAERTADLTRSNADLEQFAYAASHDLQQPLRMVANYVGLLSQRYREHFDEKADRYIDYAVGGAKRMQALVDGLLHYSRVGTKDAAATELDVTAVVTEALANLHQHIEEAAAVVEVGPMPVVVADRVQLAQVFQNLLDNAVKFRGATPPKVSFTCRDAGSEWEFAVRDNGIGIDPKHAERIFGVFKRLHTEQEYPGTGIGLALCRKIVERHGGRIHVEPTEGGGSVFLFTLPKRPATRSNEPAGLQSEEDS